MTVGNFTFTETEIKGVYVIETKRFGDNRGYFIETYKKSDFDKAGLVYVFVQDNQSSSRKGVLRGLHFQKTFPQAKLVRVLRGEVFDVAVDLRYGSQTYGKWTGVLLSAENGTTRAVVMLIHVAATAPMTMVPTITMEERRAADWGPTRASTAEPPSS